MSKEEEEGITALGSHDSIDLRKVVFLSEEGGCPGGSRCLRLQLRHRDCQIGYEAFLSSRRS